MILLDNNRPLGLEGLEGLLELPTLLLPATLGGCETSGSLIKFSQTPC